MNRTSAGFSLALIGAALIAGPADAHITLEGGKAAAGSSYKAILRVPHGCQGAATKAIRVRIPEGMVDVKPMPKSGWKLMTVKGKLSQPYVSEQGATITEGVMEVDWTGGALPDDEYDEFVLHGRLPNKPGATLYFPIVQECETGVNRWIEIPAAGKSPADYKQPAPSLLLLPPPAN